VHARIVYGTYLMKKLRAAREAERQAVRPHSKREGRQQPNAKRQTTKGNAAKRGDSNGYKLPDLRQMALDFTGPASPPET
jgi:hypothetical protein